jgi:glycine dehydrogenase subunit 2
MGFDVIHMNLHKTFSTPHGGGGPGSGAIGVGKRLLPFMPVPIVGRDGEGDDAGYRWVDERELPQSIGRLSAFMGNAGVLLRAYVYMRMLGKEGMARVSEFATLNANYLQARLRDAGFELAFPTRRATHEFIVTMKKSAKSVSLTAMDVAKALLDKDMHAPTTYFPLLVPECLLIEPTETESREALDRFVAAMIEIVEEATASPGTHKESPHAMPVRRLDDVKAARNLDLAYRAEAG